MSISFFVEGIPAPGGSKKYVGQNKRTGRALLVDAGGKKNKVWRSVVAMEGKKAMKGLEPLTGPLSVTVNFFMPRPKYHFTSKGAFKKDTPFHHTVKPDATKLMRSTEDALTGVCWGDDAQIVEQTVHKSYDESEGCPGAHICIRLL